MTETPTTDKVVIKTCGGDIVYADYARRLESALRTAGAYIANQGVPRARQDVLQAIDEALK